MARLCLRAELVDASFHDAWTPTPVVDKVRIPDGLANFFVAFPT
jgi:hypothetical protein